MANSQESVGDKIERLIEEWSEHLKANQSLAQECAILSLTHFYDHGNPIYLNRMLRVIEQIGENYLRPAAFKQWVWLFAPVKGVEEINKKTGKKVTVFAKDKKRAGEMHRDVFLPKAKELLWWHAKKDKEMSVFDTYDFFKDLVSLCNRYLSDKRVAFAKDPHVVEVIAKMKAEAEMKKSVALVQRQGNVVSFTPPVPPAPEPQDEEDEEEEMTRGEAEVAAEVAAEALKEAEMAAATA